ncbi:hypothetical protein N7524_003924, partial [Penicillium chrysogenum]
ANPRPKSFRDIVLYHRDSLINLLQWTSYHLNLVGCRFEDIGTPPICAESTQNDHRNNNRRKPYRKSSNDTELVTINLFPIIKRRRLINILVSKERHFSYSSVNGDRRRQFEPCPGPIGVMNSVRASICQERLAQTTPKKWTEDPYFLYHLLALTQLQERKLHLSKPKIYTTGNTYFITRLPYKPYLTFAGRLVAELMAPSPLPSHGPFNPSDEVTSVFEYGRKRPREQGDNGSYIASKGVRGSFISGLRRR